MRANTTTNGQWWKGFGSAIVLLVVLSVGVRAARWVAAHPSLEAIVGTVVEALTTPVFSVADLVQIAMLLVILYAVVYMLAFGPRVRA